MDKFINKDCESNIGLDLLANQDKMNKGKNRNFTVNNTVEYDRILEEFRYFMCEKIRKFDPIRKRDTYDTYIKNIWFHYLLGDKTKNEYFELYEFLNINTKGENTHLTENSDIDKGTDDIDQNTNI